MEEGQGWFDILQDNIFVIITLMLLMYLVRKLLSNQNPDAIIPYLPGGGRKLGK